MAPFSSADLLSKNSTEAAVTFCRSYYPALESRRSTIKNFYVEPITMQGGKSLPHILFNGNAVANGAAVQEIFEKQMPVTKYDIRSVDCHVLNPDYVQPGATAPAGSPKQFSMVVLVGGSVTFGETKEGEKGFSETFVLVPAPETGKRPLRGAKEYLIQSQTFRELT